MPASHLLRKKRNKAQRADHRQKLADMRLKGLTIEQIVTATRLSKSTVHRELRALTADWRAATAETIDTHRQRELAKLEVSEWQAWTEWERSRSIYWKETTERVKGAGEQGNFETDPKVVKHETGSRVGDPKFLQVILNIMRRRAKLLGLDAATKVAPTDPTGEKSYANMSYEEIEARIDELSSKRAAAA